MDNPKLLEAYHKLRIAAIAGAAYSNALMELQNEGKAGQIVDGDQANNLDALFEDWHDKTHEALDACNQVKL